jgi:hypothetical protein
MVGSGFFASPVPQWPPHPSRSSPPAPQAGLGWMHKYLLDVVYLITAFGHYFILYNGGIIMNDYLIFISAVSRPPSTPRGPNNPLPVTFIWTVSKTGLPHEFSSLAPNEPNLGPKIIRHGYQRPRVGPNYVPYWQGPS